MEEKIDIMSQGYGIIPKSIMRDKTLSIESKAIYAYLASFAGAGSESFPSVELIIVELNISENRYYKYRQELIEKGYIKIHANRKGNRRTHNVYELVGHIKFNKEVKEEIKTENSSLDKNATEEATEKEAAEEVKVARRIHSKAEIKAQDIVNMFSNICVSFPKITKISESRKKAINARLKTYTEEDFKKLFEKAEKSDFLKGKNNRDWSANFDWLIKDANMAKVLDGNYDNKTPNMNQTSPNYQGYQNYQNNQREITPSSTPDTPNRFNRFGQRNYTQEELEEIELRLLNRQ